MSETPLRVLIVEDSPTDAKLVARALRELGRPVEFERVDDQSGMRAALSVGTWDLIISDWALPRFSGLAALAVARQVNSHLPFIIVSGEIGKGAEVEARRAGAHDYLLKNNLTRLVAAVERELRQREAGRHRGPDEKLLPTGDGSAERGMAGASIVDVPGDTAARQRADEICESAIRDADLTKQRLMLSRQERIEPQVLDVSEVIGAMDRMLRRLLTAGVELKTVLGQSPDKIKADRGNLEQVIVNVVVNACEAMPAGGTITVETGKATLDEEYQRSHAGARTGRYVMLAVTDTGIGMDEATQARIFEPFFSTKEKGKGTGLGLATVDAIVRQIGGSIWLSSRPGLGTTFRIYLPRYMVVG